MTQCKACGKEIAKGVKKCPHCGKDQRNFFMKHKIFSVVLVLILFGGLATAFGGDDSNPTSGGVTSNKDSESNIDEENEEKIEFSIGETISFDDFDLTLSNQRDVDGYSDTYTVFDVEIISKKDGFTFFGSFQGVTYDNEVIDDTIAITEIDLGDYIGTSFTKDLDKDQKAKGYLAFDREIEFIELSSSLFSKEKIKIVLDN